MALVITLVQRPQTFAPMAARVTIRQPEIDSSARAQQDITETGVPASTHARDNLA